ncbi:hypothetical protein BZA70DRAFT_273353 [Myxozyma melibiosi]|uniref:Chitin synthase activator n=1 Tax=Myxozyma melibiosi TaxID=54550 RepID=A0ABR1FFT4_9ASCO
MSSFVDDRYTGGFAAPGSFQDRSPLDGFKNLSLSGSQYTAPNQQPLAETENMFLFDSGQRSVSRSRAPGGLLDPNYQPHRDLSPSAYSTEHTTPLSRPSTPGGPRPVYSSSPKSRSPARPQASEPSNQFIPEPGFPMVTTQGVNLPPSFPMELRDIKAEWAAIAAGQADYSRQLQWALRLFRLHGTSSHMFPPQDRELLDRALHLVQSLSTDQVPELLYYKGVWSEKGQRGMEKSQTRAFEYYQQAAEAGFLRAYYRMGMMYEKKKRIAEAVNCFQRGAVEYDCGCCFALALIYLNGLHQQVRDPTLAFNYLRAAAEKADFDVPVPAYIYGLALLDEDPQWSGASDSLFSNPALGRKFLEQAALLSVSASQVRLGVAWQTRELGCEYDPPISLHYYALASRSGDPSAYMGLSSWYFSGDADYNFPVNEELAVSLASKAADKGNVKAYFAMGYFCEVGICMPQNLEEAKRWYNLGAAKNSQDCINRLNELSLKRQLSTEFHAKRLEEKRNIQRSMTLQRKKKNENGKAALPSNTAAAAVVAATAVGEQQFEERGRATSSSKGVSPAGPRMPDQNSHRASFNAVLSPPPDSPVKIRQQEENMFFSLTDASSRRSSAQGYDTLDPKMDMARDGNSYRRSSQSPLRSEYLAQPVPKNRSVSASPMESSVSESALGYNSLPVRTNDNRSVSPNYRPRSSIPTEWSQGRPQQQYTPVNSYGRTSPQPNTSPAPRASLASRVATPPPFQNIPALTPDQDRRRSSANVSPRPSPRVSMDRPRYSPPRVPQTQGTSSTGYLQQGESQYADSRRRSSGNEFYDIGAPELGSRHESFSSMTTSTTLTSASTVSTGLSSVSSAATSVNSSSLKSMIIDPDAGPNSVDKIFAGKGAQAPRKKKAPQTFEEMGIPKPSKESDCVVM